MDKPTVRLAGPSELQQLVEAYDWLFAPPGSTPPDWDPAVAAGRLSRTMAGPRSTIHVAVDDRRVVGFGTTYLDIESVRYGPRAWTEDLAVDPDYRSGGIGAQLLAAAQQWAGDRGASYLVLESSVHRKDAHRFYERQNPVFTAISFRWDLG